MSNRLSVALKECRDVTAELEPYDCGYFEIDISDDEEASVTYLGRPGDEAVADACRRLKEDPLGLILEYGAAGHAEMARERGAYVCGDWMTAEELRRLAGEEE